MFVLVAILLLNVSLSTVGNNSLIQSIHNNKIINKETSNYLYGSTSVLVRIYEPEESRSLIQKYDFVGWKPDEWIDVIVPGYQMPDIADNYQDYTVLLDDVEEYNNMVKGDYHTYPEMESFLQNIANNYSSITNLYTIGITYEGRNIWCLEISDNPGVDEGEPGVFYMGLHHAREWPSLEICLYIADNLTSNYGIDPDITNVIDNRRLWIVPCVNPDGYVYDHDLGNDWRKNRHYFPEYGTYGVDLNRNYGGSSNGDPWGSWGTMGDASGHVSHYPSNSLYCGPWALSELETQAVRDVFLQNDICAGITWHTYSELVGWPWGYSQTKVTPDNSYISQVGQNIASRITKQSGSGAYQPMQASSLYPVTGSTCDWAYGYGHFVLGRPTFTFLIEACSSFHPSSYYLDQICRENFDGGLYLLQEADNINNVTPRVLPPKINYMYSDNDGDYTISWNQLNPEAQPDYYQLDELTNLSIFTEDVESGASLWDLEGFSVSTTRSHSSIHSFKSRYTDEDASSITTVYPIPVTEDMNLSFWSWYEIEDNYDMGFVEISTDGRSFILLDTFNGDSNGWVFNEYSLNNYVNESIFIRFRYTTDSNTLDEGFYVDDIYPVADFSAITTLSTTIYNNYFEVFDKTEGVYYYQVRGYNTAHGWGDFSTLESINVTTVTIPILISNILSTPQAQVPNGWVNITCNVSAIGSISQVKTRLTYPDDTFINQSMNNIPSTYIYYLNATYQPEGIYTFNIWAKDTEGNQTNSDFFQFYIGYNSTIIPLTIGWNQITIPVENSSYGMASNLGDNITGCLQVSYWNNTMGQYQSWLVGISDPTDDYPILPGRSYFLSVSIDSTFFIEGTSISSISIPLGIGWNMIGWFNKSATMASSLGDNITGCLQVSYWNNTMGQYQSWLVGISDPTEDYIINCGMGVFVSVNAASVWHGEG